MLGQGQPVLLAHMGNCAIPLPWVEKGIGPTAVYAKIYVIFVACTLKVPIVVVHCSELKNLQLIEKYWSNTANKKCPCFGGVTERRKIPVLVLSLKGKKNVPASLVSTKGKNVPVCVAKWKNGTLSVKKKK